MPKLIEMQAYVIGVRIEQARRLTRKSFPPTIVYAAYSRLLIAVDQFLVTGSTSQIAGQLRSSVEQILRRLENQSPQRQSGDSEYEVCLNDLEVVEALFVSCLDCVNLGKERDWFNAGKLIVRGESGDCPGPTEAVHPDNCAVTKWSPRRIWEWDDPAALLEVLHRLEVEEVILFPRESIENDWLARLPARLSEWGRVEVGLHAIRSSITEQATGVDCGATTYDARAASPDRPATVPPVHILGPLQKAILKALEGRVLRVRQIADQTTGGDVRRLYKRHGLNELKNDLKLVVKSSQGYFRPDAPPRDDANS